MHFYKLNFLKLKCYKCHESTQDVPIIVNYSKNQYSLQKYLRKNNYGFLYYFHMMGCFVEIYDIKCQLNSLHFQKVHYRTQNISRGSIIMQGIDQQHAVDLLLWVYLTLLLTFLKKGNLDIILLCVKYTLKLTLTIKKANGLLRI